MDLTKAAPPGRKGPAPGFSARVHWPLSFPTVCLSFMLDLHQLLLHDILGAGIDHALKDCRLGGPGDKHKAPFLLSSLS